MAYNISLTNGTQLVVLLDGSADTTFTSLTLLGKNFTGYGKFLNENFVHLLENFANNVEPENPLVGQLWFDTGTKSMKLRDTPLTWKTIGAQANVSNTTPANPVTGDLWFDNAKKQLYVYSGSAWLLVGPPFSIDTGISGTIPEIIKDTNNISHVVVKTYIDETVVAVWTKEETSFTVAPDFRIDGFSDPLADQILYPGLNMAQPGNWSLDANTSIDKNAIWGNVSNAYNLGGQPPANYFRKDGAGGKQTIENEVEINNVVTIEDELRVGADIVPLDDKLHSLGNVDYRFKSIFVDQLNANIVIGNTGLNSTDNLSEGSTNLYFTANRARQSVSSTGVITYNSNTGVISANLSSYYTKTEIDSQLTTISGNVSTLANVARTGSYTDLINKPANPLPIGGIMMWSGSISNIPSGWVLCDGTNGTPDLRNRFVVGAGNIYVVGATGGSADANIIAHSHTATISDGGLHNHLTGNNEEANAFGTQNTARYGYGDLWAGVRDPTAYGNGYDTYTSTGGSHSHTITINAQGEPATGKNLPPYYALCFIMFKGI